MFFNSFCFSFCPKPKRMVFDWDVCETGILQEKEKVQKNTLKTTTTKNVFFSASFCCPLLSFSEAAVRKVPHSDLRLSTTRFGSGKFRVSSARAECPSRDARTLLTGGASEHMVSAGEILACSSIHSFIHTFTIMHRLRLLALHSLVYSTVRSFIH